MKYAILGEHQKFFRNHQYVEFEGLLSDLHVEELKESIIHSLCSRLGISKENLFLRNFDDLFAAGHDTFRQDFNVRKLVTKKNLGEIAFELSNEKPVRLAYDQTLFAGKITVKNHQDPIKEDFLDLKKISGLQGNVYGLMLCLDPGTNKDLKPPYSPKKGSGIYFTESLPFSFKNFYTNPGALYILIVFCGARSLVLQEQFFPYAYKHLGYATGDFLRDDLHPVVFR